MFARDIHNAIRCSVLSRDFKNVYYWGERLAKKGLSLKYFDAQIFKNLKRNKDWKKFSTHFDSISSIANKNINVNLKKKLEELLQEDQADYGLENRKESEMLYATTERVTEKLVDLLKKEGFPSEEKIGVYTINDTVIISSPEYNVLIRHAVQQKPKNLKTLIALLDISAGALEYDKNRNFNHKNFGYSCYHIYKGCLYKNRSCGNNDILKRKIIFMFHNKNNFIVEQEDYTISEYNKESPEEYDNFYKDNFDFVMKITDNWEFYGE